jgi:hypothetical protein
MAAVAQSHGHEEESSEHKMEHWLINLGQTCFATNVGVRALSVISVLYICPLHTDVSAHPCS